MWQFLYTCDSWSAFTAPDKGTFSFLLRSPRYSSVLGCSTFINRNTCTRDDKAFTIPYCVPTCSCASFYAGKMNKIKYQDQRQEWFFLSQKHLLRFVLFWKAILLINIHVLPFPSRVYACGFYFIDLSFSLSDIYSWKVILPFKRNQNKIM